MPLIEIRDICFQERSHTVLQDISFTQTEFRKLVIAGETGSGKSTLLQIIAGLTQPTAGQVFFEGKRVLGPQEVLVPGEPGIAYLSQHFELPKFLRVEQVLQYARKIPADEAKNLYEVCHIEHLLKRKTDELSGGERQRIALARLLLSAPRLLLLDEPFSNLDTGHKNLLKTVLAELTENLEITCLLVSHDPLDTLSWAEEILILQNGQIVQQGTPQEIYRHPANEYIAALFGSYNLIPATVAPLFGNIAGIEGNGKNLLVRPEHFKFAFSPENAIPGTVKSARYFGSHSLVELAVSDLRLTVKTLGFPPEKGEPVFITVAPEDLWYI